ncbi:SAM-dependent methyltransferase [Streptomyces sp. MBT70]|nr:SAM-dependent methyltransferase [Streptomyces sp. MBT70]
METDTGRPRPARMDDRYPGGKDNHPLDEAMGRRPPARTAGSR